MTTKNLIWCSAQLLALAGLGLLGRVAEAADPPAYPPVVHILAVDSDAAEEGSDPALFLVLRVGPTNAPLTVSYVTGGVAENGVDYAHLPGSITIPAGAFMAPIEVVPFDDFLVEGTETVLLALDQPVQWPPPYFVSWPNIAAAFIEDNDAPPTNQPPVVRLINPPDGAVFTAPVDVPLLARANDPDGRVVTVEFFANGVSLGLVTNRPPLVWADALAADSLDALIEVEADRLPDVDLAPEPRPLPDPLPVPDSLFRLLWANAPPGTYELTAVATDNRGASATSAPVTIRILDAPPQPVVRVLASDPVATEPDPAGPRLDNGTFTIQRTGPTNFPLVVWYRLGGTASNGVDYAELARSATIPEGARSVEVVVRPLADEVVEGEETVVLTIVPPVCITIYPPPPDCYLVGRPNTATVVIRDRTQPPNLPPVARLVRPLDGSVFLAPATITLAALAWDADGRVVSVEFFANDVSLGVVPNPLLSTTSASLTTASRPLFALTWSNVPPGHYVLRAEATDNLGARGRSQPVEIKVTPRPFPPVVTITAPDPIATEPGGPLPVMDTATFSVHRTGSTADPLSVHYSIRGTAENGVDYRRISNQVVIPRGAASADIVIHPLADLLVEGPESVILRLEPPVCIEVYPPPVDCYYVVGTPAAARAIIRDSNAAPTNLPPKVALVQPQDGEVFRPFSDVVLLAAAHDADGWVRTVEFFEGNRSLGVVTNPWPDVTTVDPPGLSTVEANVDRLFRLVWPDVPPGGYILTALATDNRGATTRSAPVRIRVLDEPLPPVVTIHATDPYASEGGRFPWDPWPSEELQAANAGVDLMGPPIIIRPDTATFTVRRSGGTNVPLVVHYSLSGTAANGVDYLRLSGEVTIPRGAWSANVVVTPMDDAVVEGTETVIARLEPIACPLVWPPPPECYTVGEPSRAVAQIFDNDFNQSPKVEIVGPPDGAMFVAPAEIEIHVLARDPDGWVSRVEFYEGENLIGVEEIFFIVPPPPGQLQRFSLTWTNVPAGRYVLTARAFDERGARSVSDPIHVRVFDHQPLPVVTIFPTDPVGSEIHPDLDVIPDPAVFTVYRTGSTAKPLKVFYQIGGTATNGQDYEELPGVVEIPAGDAKADIVVHVTDDDLVEGTETVVLSLTQLRCVTEEGPPVEGCYLVGTPGRALAYLRDNDTPPNQPPKVAIVNPPDGAVFTAPADIRLVANAEDADGWVRTVEFFANNVSLGIVTNRPWIVEPVRFADLQGAVLTDMQPLPVPVRNPFVLPWPNVPAGHYVLTALATDNLGATTRSRPVEIKVRAPQQPPLVRLVAVDGFAQEGTDNHAVFLFFLAAPTPVPLTVHYSLSGTAENGVDYLRIPTQITIPAGRAWARLRVVAMDDGLPEPIETVVLQLAPSPVDPVAYEIGEPSQAGAIIVDGRAPRPPSQRLPDGRVHLYVPLPQGVPYRLEASFNLVDWEPVIANAIVEDEVHFVDDGRHGAGQRFFRVVPEIEVLATEE